jgi:hypothetical protein
LNIFVFISWSGVKNLKKAKALCILIFSKKKTKITPTKKTSGVDNWYLDEFFEEFICGR